MCRSFSALCLIFSLTHSNLIAQTNYYWIGSGSIADPSNWGTNLDGTGSHPANFNSVNQIFNMQSGQSTTPTSQWIISGVGSKLNLQTGSTFTAGAFDHNLTVDLAAGSTYSLNSAYPSLILGTLDPGGVVNFSGNSNSILRNLSYGSLRFNVSSPAQVLNQNLTLTGNLQQSGNAELRLGSTTASVVSVGKDVVIDSGKTLNLTSGSANTSLNISGNLSNSGTISKTGGGTSSINFTGAGSNTANWGTISNAISVSIVSTKTITFASNFSNVSSPITNNGTLILASGTSTSGSISSNGLLAGLGKATGGVTINSGGTIRGDTNQGTGTFTSEGSLTITGASSNGAKILTQTNRNISSGAGTVANPYLIESSKIAVIGVSNFNFAATNTNKFQLEVRNGASPLLPGETYRITIGTIDAQAQFQLNGTSLGANNIIASSNYLLSSPDFASFNNVTLGIGASGTNLDLTFTPVPEPASVFGLITLAVGISHASRRLIRK